MDDIKVCAVLVEHAGYYFGGDDLSLAEFILLVDAVDVLHDYGLLSNEVFNFAWDLMHLVDSFHVRSQKATGSEVIANG